MSAYTRLLCLVTRDGSMNPVAALDTGFDLEAWRAARADAFRLLDARPIIISVPIWPPVQE